MWLATLGGARLAATRQQVVSFQVRVVREHLVDAHPADNSSSSISTG
jgi:hypothetical protein